MAWGCGLALLACCLVITWKAHPIGDYFAESDFYGGYAQGATLLQHGHLVPSRYHVIGPGYELALATVGFLVRDLFLAAQLLSAVSIAAATLLWFHLLRPRIGPVGAACTTLLMTANPTLLRYGYSATTDAFAIGVQAFALWALLTRRTAFWAFAAGAITALAVLTRYTALALVPAGIVAVLLDDAFRDRRRRSLLLYGVGLALPLGGWLAFAWASGDRPASELHHLLAFEAFARARGLTWDQYQRDLQPKFHGMWDVIRYDPAGFSSHLARNAWDHARQDAQRLLGIPSALAVVAGMLWAAIGRDARRLLPIAVAGLATYLLLLPVPYGERYSLAILPAYLAFAGIALGWPSRARARDAARFLPRRAFLVLVPLVASLIASVRHQRETLAQLPREVLDSGRVLHQRRRPGDGVIARKAHLAYVAGVRSVPFPFTTTLGELAAYAERTRARWLYVSWPEVESRPDYYPLLDTTGVIPGLTPRWVSPGNPGVLYEIDPAFARRAGWPSDPQVMNLRVARARLRLVPDDIEAMWLEAMTEIVVGDGARARATLVQAARIDSRSQEVLDALARADSSGSVAILERLLSSAVSSPRSRTPNPRGGIQ